MAILGVQFDKMRVTPAMDGFKDEALAGSGEFISWHVGYPVADGMNVRIPAGGYVIRGRHVRVVDPVMVPIPANFVGFVVLTIDLTKSNDSSGNPVYDNYSVTNNQIYFRAILPGNVRNEDINAGGQVWDSVMCAVTSNATSITEVNYQDTTVYKTPNPGDIRRVTVKNDRVYAKQAMFDVTVVNKYRQFGLLLKRQGSRVTAQVNMKTVTTLAWEQLAELSNYPGYKPDGGDYSGILNEMSYNTEPGGLYIAGTSLRMMHVGRTDVKECNYSGAITYFTNDDFPSDSDIVTGWRQL